MKILIVEDDDYKSDNLIRIAKLRFSSPEIYLAISLSEAIDKIDELLFDLIFIDMAIPSHVAIQGEGSPLPLTTGGIDILIELANIGRDDKCIVVTQFPSIEISGEHYSMGKAKEEFMNILGCNVLACIYYVQDDKRWENQLNRVLQSL